MAILKIKFLMICLVAGLSANKAATTTVKAATTTVKAATTTAKAAATTTVKAATTTVAATTTSSCSCSSGLSCCNTQCYSSSSYSCPTDSYTGKSVLCSGTSTQACNGACYSTSSYTCKDGKLVSGAAGTTTTSSSSTTSTYTTAAHPTTTVKATTTVAATTTVKAATTTVNAGATTTVKAAATTTVKAATTTVKSAATTTASSSSTYPTQTADLRIINNCASTLWIEGRYGSDGAPITGYSVTSRIAEPGGYVDWTIPSTGLSSTRFWGKYGCNSTGYNCVIGDQMQYYPNPPGGCPTDGCTPPVDSLFEATWGCKTNESCNTDNPTTWFDTSQVDGWTIPYSLVANGATDECDCDDDVCGFSGVNATTLSLAHCPTAEDLSLNGTIKTITIDGKTVDMTSVDLRMIVDDEIVGCMSPCKRINYGTPYGLGQTESSGAGLWMCCPTPDADDCLEADGCVTSAECRAGYVGSTQYVKAVHKYAPDVYAYSYDDGVGLHACPAGTVTYTMTFCPAGSSDFPLAV